MINGCISGVNSPPNLVGHWQAIYNIDDFGTRRTGTESFLIRHDGKYKQIYEDGGYRFESDWNDWSLVQLSNGAYQLHLKGGRFYPLGVTTAEALASGEKSVSLYDPISNKNISIKQEIILNIEVTGPSVGGITISHLPVGDLDMPQYVKFKLVGSSDEQ
jgi:hypothetical protein